jgi:hypothetical protein
MRIIIAGLFLASPALAQGDAPTCKGLNYEACQATPGCVFYMSAREAQAIATKKRAYLTDAERRARPPWLDTRMAW